MAEDRRAESLPVTVRTEDLLGPGDGHRVIPEGAGPCQAGFYRVFARVRAFEGMSDWPAGLLLSLGPWSALFPAAADPGERPVRVKDRAQPRRRSRAPPGALAAP